MRCYSCRKDGNRSYVKPGPEIRLYLRKYADGEIKYFVSNAPGSLAVQEPDRAATLRWPIEQCFEECKSNLGMGHYECRSYQGWNRHMLFMMIAHLFTIYIREIFKKEIALTMPMAVKLMHGIITYTVTNMKAIVCYHICRSHCAYLAHRKTTLSKVRCSIRHFIKKDLQYIGGIISSFPMMFPAPIFVVCKCRICLAKIVHSPPEGL